MTKWHLQAPGSSVYFSYRCCTPSYTSLSCRDTESSHFSSRRRGQHMADFDGGAPFCNTDEWMRWWHIRVWSGDNDWYAIEYGCCSFTGFTPGPAVEFFTDFYDDGGGNSAYMDRHNSECPYGMAMNGYQLWTDRGVSPWVYRNRYNCIAIPDPTEWSHDWIDLSGMATSQSCDNNGDQVASKAIDLSADGTRSNNRCSRTCWEWNAWWKIDLGQPYEISKVRRTVSQITESGILERCSAQ
jgi:hypothetical protein